LGETDDASGFAYHDGAAVLLRDGQIVAATEEERLNRVKHSNFFPMRAIHFCLNSAGVRLEDVDAIVTDSSEEFYDFIILRNAARNPRAVRQSARDLIADTFQRQFGMDVSKKLRFCSHHVAHLFGAWYPSGFTECLAICLDGDGDGASGLVAHCEGNEFTVLRRLPEQLSLGNFYTAQLSFIGYKRFDEYKVMGLAPYGDPTVFKPLFEKMYQLQPDGRFSLASEVQVLMLMKEAGLADKYRRRGEPFLQVHKDFAAALQQALEDMCMHVIKHFRRQTSCRRLCLSGGVAHNCAMNGTVLRSGLFDEIFVQPAAHDAGNALGAALAVMRDAKRPRPLDVMPHVFLGRDIGLTNDIEMRLRRWMPLIDIELLDDAPESAAGLLAEGLVIGWVQGRSEFGPRALGNRSILADPRPAENKRTINAMIKKREDYRPFAPSIVEERLREFFEVPATVDNLPYMVVAVPAKPEVRSLLAAVTHVDGSARVQSVSRLQNPRYHALIAAFGRRTGVPIVLNTSFNNNAEPIVDSVDDAVATFLTTGIQAVVIGDWLVRKVADVAHHSALLDMGCELLPSRKLVRRSTSNGSGYFIETTAGEYFGESSTSVSPVVFDLLLHHAGPVRRYLVEDCSDDSGPVAASVATELFALWSARAIRLVPSAD